MKPFYALTACATLSSLLGCSASFAPSGTAALANGVRLAGSAHGGQQPLTASHLYLMAAGKTGYGSASTSLLKTSSAGVTADDSGNGFVTTDAGGNFTITGDWTCPTASDQIYMLAIGGNPGLTAGTNNSAIVMMDALGTCSTLSSSTFIILNELSTVAAATALQQFYLDPIHIGVSATNATGIANAFATANNLVDIASEPSARATTLAGNGTVPQATIDTLANILSACVNSANGGSTPCSALFLFATPSGGAATETLTAAVDIAMNPTRHAAALFSLSPASPPFLPALAAAPADYTIGINYSLGVPAALPGSLAIDGSGNVWISNRPSQNLSGVNDTIVKLGPTGQILSGTGFTATGGITLPEGIAVDDTGAVWVANTSNIIKLNNDGSTASGTPFYGGNYPQGIALDKTGRAWISNFGSMGQGNTVTVLTPTGSLITNFALPNFSGANGIAVDAFNNVWVAGQGTSNLVEIASDFTFKSGTGGGFTGGGLNAPSGIAIDGNQQIWAANSFFGRGSATLSLFNQSGTPISTTSGYAVSTRGYVNILAIDGLGTAWAGVCGPNCVGGGAKDSISHTSAAGVLVNSPGFLNPTLASPQAVAIDASGNLWVGNAGVSAGATTGTVTELVGVAAPVKTPIQSALKSNLLGIRP